MKTILNKIITVIGKKGYGKTTLVKLLVLLSNKPSIIIDPRFQFENEHYLYFNNTENAEQWLKDNFQKFYAFNKKIVIQSAEKQKIDSFLEFIYKYFKDIVLVIDEIDMFYNQKGFNDETSFYKLIHYGRHSRIDIITTSRRPANIPKDLTSQTDEFCLFQTKENNDIKYLSQYLYGQEVFETLRNLERFKYMEYDTEKDEFKIKRLDKSILKYV